MSEHAIDQFLTLEHVQRPPPSTADHAPLPWKYCGCGKCGLIWSIPADACIAKAIMKTMEEGEIMTAEQRQANAEFIVRAVNAHDKLLAACRWQVSGCNCDDGCFRCEKARAALKKEEPTLSPGEDEHSPS